MSGDAVTPDTERLHAPRELADAVIEALKTERGVHAESAVAAAARMAGTSLLRSFGLPLTELEPGQVLLSDKANGEGPQLLQLMLDALAAMQVEIDGREIAQPIPPGYEPLVDLQETQRRLDPAFARLRERLGLSEREIAESAAIATAILIRQCAGVLAPSTAGAIAALGFVEGSKTVPAR